MHYILISAVRMCNEISYTLNGWFKVSHNASWKVVYNRWSLSLMSFLGVTKHSLHQTTAKFFWENKQQNIGHWNNASHQPWDVYKPTFSFVVILSHNQNFFLRWSVSRSHIYSEDSKELYYCKQEDTSYQCNSIINSPCRYLMLCKGALCFTSVCANIREKQPCV